MDTERRFAVGLIVLAGLLILYGVLFREEGGGGRPRERRASCTRRGQA